MNSVLLQYAQTVGKDPMQYADDLFANPCTDADTYDEATVNGIFVEGVYYFISHSPGIFWVAIPPGNICGTALHT